MQKLIAFVKAKSITDTSMAIAYKMITENLDKQEDCILALFEAIYETNRQLADEVVKQRAKSPKIITSSKIG